VEYDDEVIHVIAAQITDANASLHALSGDPSGQASSPLRGGHPRNARVIPKSRDFH
jgi:error-prone DNA polymerase